MCEYHINKEGELVAGLPNEIWTHILDFIPAEESLAPRFVCVTWNYIIKEKKSIIDTKLAENLYLCCFKNNYEALLFWYRDKGFVIDIPRSFSWHHTKSAEYYAAKNGNPTLLRFIEDTIIPERHTKKQSAPQKRRINALIAIAGAVKSNNGSMVDHIFSTYIPHVSEDVKHHINNTLKEHTDTEVDLMTVSSFRDMLMLFSWRFLKDKRLYPEMLECLLKYLPVNRQALTEMSKVPHPETFAKALRLFYMSYIKDSGETAEKNIQHLTLVSTNICGASLKNLNTKHGEYNFVEDQMALHALKVARGFGVLIFAECVTLAIKMRYYLVVEYLTAILDKKTTPSISDVYCAVARSGSLTMLKYVEAHVIPVIRTESSKGMSVSKMLYFSLHSATPWSTELVSFLVDKVLCAVDETRQLILHECVNNFFSTPDCNSKRHVDAFRKMYEALCPKYRKKVEHSAVQGAHAYVFKSSFFKRPSEWEDSLVHDAVTSHNTDVLVWFLQNGGYPPDNMIGLMITNGLYHKLNGLLESGYRLSKQDCCVRVHFRNGDGSRELRSVSLYAALQNAFRDCRYIATKEEITKIIRMCYAAGYAPAESEIIL